MPGMRSDDGHALEHGSAPDLIFSQHDVMRDLALYLGRNNRPLSQRTRLLMPQQGRNIPMKWQSVEPLAAQIISINTGPLQVKPPSRLRYFNYFPWRGCLL